MTYRIGLLGLGSAGRMHLTAINDTPGAAVRGVCDTDAELVKQVAQKVGAQTYTTAYLQLLEDPDIDAIIVATPDQFHREHAVAALLAGKHVLCEKPMAPSEAECQEMILAADRSGRQLMIGHSVRFTPAFAAIKSLVDTGAIGDVAYVGTDYQHDYHRHAGTWRFDPALARHTFLGGGCHAVDLASWFLHDFTSVTAVSNRICLPELPTDDCMIATYVCEGQQIARVFVAAGCQRPYQIGLEVYGTEGTAMATNVGLDTKIWVKNLSSLGSDWLTTPIRDAETHPARLQLQHFLDCLQSGAEPLITGRDGLQTVRAALAAIQASSTGSSIQVPTS